MKKIKLLWCSDINNSTGFGQVAIESLSRLSRMGKYDLVAMAVNHRGERTGIEGLHVYSLDSSDPYGFNRFPDIVIRENPDVILILNDLFVAEKYVAFLAEHRPDIPLVLYFPIDGNSTPPGWLNAVRYATIPIAYSEYGKDLIESRIPEVKSKLRLIYHGINTDVLHPLSDPERIDARSRHGGGPDLRDKFLVVSVNRYQPRKLVPLTLRAFALFYYGYKVCAECGNYYLPSLDKCDLNFCSRVEREVPGHSDAVIYLHMNEFEPAMGGETNTLKHYIDSAGLGQSGVVMVPGVDILNPSTSPSREEMNRIYNMSDCFVATDCGEGFGLTPVEAYATGVPVIKSNNTTGPELLKTYGRLPKSCGFFSMAYDSGHLRPAVHVPSVVDAMTEVYDIWIANGKKTILNMGQVAEVKRRFQWDDKVVAFSQALNDAIAMKKAEQNQIQIVRV